MIWFILALGFFLRIISLNQSLWLDEAINVLAAKNYSLLNMLTVYAQADFHPPGYFIILWLWTKVFGYSEIVVRLPSVIFGLLTIWFVFLIGQKIYSKSLGLIAALILAVNPLHIYYSQEARMYALAALAVSLNTWFFLNLIKGDKGSLGKWGGYMLSNLLVLSSDYVAYLIFPVQLIPLLISRQIHYLKRWLVPFSISLAIASIWLPLFLTQLKVGLSTTESVPVWKEVVGSFGLKPLILTYIKFIIGRIDHPDLIIYGSLFSIPGLLFLFLIWRGIKSTNQFNRNFLLSWMIIPVTFGLLISILAPIYNYFRLLFILPAFILLTALGILSFKSALRDLLVVLVIIVEVISASIYLFNPKFQREDWRGLVDFLAAKSESKILLESPGAFAPLTYYAEGKIEEIIFALKEFPANNPSDVSGLEFSLDNSKDVYLIDYLVEISDPQRLVRKELLNLGYREIDIKNFNGVGFVYHFIK